MRILIVDLTNQIVTILLVGSTLDYYPSYNISFKLDFLDYSNIYDNNNNNNVPFAVSQWDIVGWVEPPWLFSIRPSASNSGGRSGWSKPQPDNTWSREIIDGTGRVAQILEAFRKNSMVAKLCDGTKGLRRKVWTWTKSTNVCHFVTISRFAAIYALFVNLWAKKCCFLFLVKNTFFFAYYTELNLPICNNSQKKSSCRENRRYALDQTFMPFLPSPKGCQLLPPFLKQ